MTITDPTDRPQPKRSMADSPWLWFALFALMAIAALMVVGPRFARRQSQLERNYEGRRDAWQQRLSKQQPPPPTTVDTP